MDLKKIYFDAFKSLSGQELEIKDACTGFVGINESGKSNILFAVHVLGGERKLNKADKPKRDVSKDPKLRFEFVPTKNERSQILNAIKEWANNNTLIGKSLKRSDFNVIYTVEYNIEKEAEIRHYSLSHFEINKDYFVLKREYYDDPWCLASADTFIPLNKAIIISDKDLRNNNDYLKIISDLDAINQDIENLEDEIKEMNEGIKEKDPGKPKQPEEETSEKSDDSPKEKNQPVRNEIQKKTNDLEKFTKKKDVLEAKLSGFNHRHMMIKLEEDIGASQANISNIKTKIQEMKAAIKELKREAEPNEDQKNELNIQGKSLQQITTKLSTKELKHSELKRKLGDLKLPLEKKYTKQTEDLNKYLGNIIKEVIDPLLPKVVFWEHKQEYILSSETKFNDLIDGDGLNDLSRPLVNLFRVGIDVKTMEGMRTEIKTIQDDANMRSRIQKRLNDGVNKYIKSVWNDYNQEINITLEQDKIRIEVYDPDVKDAAYFNMEERSQGAQTFISFLLTIGAESEKGVISNTILLLDEPETHLHPSGVRFMLKELINIANNDNIVMYATHSIFMIDREKYERHIILKRTNEQTEIMPSSKDRIGFFMQEEVLYGTLDINLNKDFTSTNRYNFVFEGYGDAILFEHYYRKILEEHPYNVKGTSFFHGGKCSDIEKYFQNRPIQLGTKWILILDRDKPANNLKKVMEGKYKDYIGKDIFIYQYDGDNGDKLSESELEDLMPLELIIDSYKKIAEENGVEADESIIKNVIDESKYFEKYNKEIIGILFNRTAPEMIKGRLKEAINKQIQERIDKASEKSEFKKTFPKYLLWVQKVTSSLSISEGKKTERKQSETSPKGVENGGKGKQSED